MKMPSHAAMLAAVSKGVPQDGSVSGPLMGIALLVSALWVLSALDSTGKWLMGAGLPLVLVCWVRYAGHLLICLAVLLPVKGSRILQSKVPKLQIIRGMLVCAATMAFFATLKYLPLAEATAINFLAPLMMLIAAPFILKEKSRPSRWVAAIVAFMGVLVVIRPGTALHPTGTLMGLGTACLMCAQHMSTRQLSPDNPFTSLLWSGLTGTLLLTPLLLWQWQDAMATIASLDVIQQILLISTGITGALGHFLLISAYRNAPASALAPFIYLQIVSASAIGWLVWGDFPDATTWVGIGIICASGVAIALREWHVGRCIRHNTAAR